MGNGNGNPEIELGMTIALLIKVPIVPKGSAGEGKRGDASEPPASCHGHHCLGSNAISAQNKDSEIKEEDSKLD